MAFIKFINLAIIATLALQIDAFNVPQVGNLIPLKTSFLGGFGGSSCQPPCPQPQPCVLPRPCPPPVPCQPPVNPCAPPQPSFNKDAIWAALARKISAKSQVASAFKQVKTAKIGLKSAIKQTKMSKITSLIPQSSGQCGCQAPVCCPLPPCPRPCPPPPCPNPCGPNVGPFGGPGPVDVTDAIATSSAVLSEPIPV